MTSYKFGEIVLVKFPFTDQTTTKKRPAVIVSSTAYNLTRPDLILMAITSQVRKPLKSDEVEIINWTSAGLLKASIIKPVFTTVEKGLILQHLGNLDDGDKESLRQILLTVLG